MSRSNLLTKQEVAELAGRSERTIERTLEPAMPGAIGRNGKPEPLYDLAALPVEVQAKWAATEQRRVVEIAPAEESNQLALALTIPVGPNLSAADRVEATRRFGVIEALVDRDKYGMLWAQYPRTADMLTYLAQAHQVKDRTIYRWLQAWKKGGLPALVRKDR